MGYEYDSKVNRELAKTAMDIYKKAHNLDQPINESRQNLNEETIRENVNGLIMNYISDVIILAEQNLGREMSQTEINEASDELLRRIDSISDADKVAFINELSEAMAPTMTGTQAAPAGGGGMMAGGGRGTGAGGGRGSGLGTARPGAAAKPNLGFRPTRGQESGEFDAANYSPANYATAAEALAAMFAAGFSSGQQIAMVLGQNWGGPSMTDGTVS
tara:strand:- start:45 stop:695 length:651 start_codon:yes stop_codon:yes gene_type:complete